MQKRMWEPRTKIEIDGDYWLINGLPTYMARRYQGISIEGPIESLLQLNRNPYQIDKVRKMSPIKTKNDLKSLPVKLFGRSFFKSL